MTSKTKILHLIKSLGRGGAEKLIPETALVHDQSRFEFHCLYFYHQVENIVDELERAGIQVHLIPSGNLGLFFQVQRVREFVKQYDFDIIHAHLPWAGILARFVGRKLDIPIVYTEHNTWDRYNKVSYWGNRLTFKQQDVAIAVSNEVALSMQLNSIWDPYKRGGRLKVKVVQNGVNTEIFKNLRDQGKGNGELSVKSQLGIPVEVPVIGKVAVFRSQKRLWLWVEIAIRILKKEPNVHFLLVGDGEWRSRIEKQILDSGFEKNFHLVGVQKEVLPFLNILDIYLSSSEFEGLPIAMLEAMACEVPVVATRAGGIGEVIQDGKQGFLTGIDEWEDLEGYCLKLLRDAELQQKMAKAARSQVVNHFSMKRMVSELEAIYDQVLRNESE
ncbi:MAG: glycosyltransferase [Algoriphagus sp.]|uniref:glycosyltransferase n=1 Tax=Algoriphagus sp. TaxID=1872435 RepID=UPI0018078804|nr:glycosyltransferase [Algoriphagus sp.]NVJ86822.1 glycosyltransferase [Algoriphagus sp.]